jgi:PAS domain S-box-containing protein
MLPEQVATAMPENALVPSQTMLAEAPPPAASARATILIVDDDVGLLRLFSKALTRSKFNCLTAETGEAALKLLAEQSVDLLLLDLGLTSLPGDQLIERQIATGKPVAFVVITGRGDERVAVRMMKRGALDYLVKDAELLKRLPLVVERALRQVESQRQLAASQAALERQAQLLDISHDAIFVWREPGGIAFWNRGAVDLYGYKLHEVLGRTTHDLLQPRFLVPWPEIEAELRKSGHWQGELRHYTKAGRELVVSARLQSVPGAGDTLLVLESTRDVTAQKQLEREVLEISEREQRRIGQDLHDDLCQRLAGIQLLSGVLSDDLIARKNRGAELAGRISAQLREVIDRARLLARGLALVGVESGGLADGLRDLAGVSSTLFGVRCEFVQDAPINVTDVSVATQLYRIAQESVTNAVKHGRAGNITISLGRDTTTAEQCVLTIADDGRGMATAGNGGGVHPPRGMGLLTMKYRATMVGAALEIRSVEGNGTTVICTFGKPLCEPSDHAPSHAGGTEEARPDRR